jgi:hypothetical protein
VLGPAVKVTGKLELAVAVTVNGADPSTSGLDSAKVIACDALFTVAVLVGVVVGMSVAVAVLVGVAVLVAVAVGTAVFVDVSVGTAVLVAVSVGIAVFVDVSVGTAVSVGVLVAVSVAVAVGVAVGTSVSVAVSVGMFVAVPVAVFVGVLATVDVLVGVAVGSTGVLVAVAMGCSPSARLWDSPAETERALTPPGRLTASGLVRAVVVPSPSWPLLLSPQA